ncbi:CvpA family protein [Hydrogenimonas sp.]
MQTNWFDVVSLLLILFIGLKGIFNKTVRELSGFLGIVAGVWIGSLYAQPLGRWLGGHLVHLDSPSAMTMLAFLLLVSLLWVLFILLGVVLTHTLKIPDFGLGDRIGGFLFASAKVFVILAVIVYFLSQIEFVRRNAEDYVHDSRLYPLFIATGKTLTRIPAHPAKPATAGAAKSESNATASAKGAK